MTYVRRGAQVETNVGQTVNRTGYETTNNVTVNNIVARDIVLDEGLEEPEQTVTEDVPHKGYVSQELWTIPVLKKIIRAINNSYFNTKLIDNIIHVDDMESILSAVINKRVTITLNEPSDKIKCLTKINCIREIAKITVNDNGTNTNFKYTFNDVYESMANDFRINMTKVFINL